MKQANVLQEFKNRVGFTPNMETPRTFNEKCLVRKLYDRRPILIQMTDKLESRELVKQANVGVDTIPILYASIFDKPRIIPPLQFPIMVKPTNKSGRNRILTKQSDFIQYVQKIYKAREKVYGQNKGEWAYSGVPSGIIVEPVITNYFEFKFWCFHGKCEMIQAIQPRSEFVPKKKDTAEAQGLSMFWPDGRLIDVKNKRWPLAYRELPGFVKPILPGVEKLSQGLDFVRVDLFYQMDLKRWYFTEYTLYPGAGHTLWEPLDFDKTLGKFWRNVECG